MECYIDCHMGQSTKKLFLPSWTQNRLGWHDSGTVMSLRAGERETRSSSAPSPHKTCGRPLEAECQNDFAIE